MDSRWPGVHHESVCEEYEEALIRAAFLEELCPDEEMPQETSATSEEMNEFFAETEERTCRKIRQMMRG